MTDQILSALRILLLVLIYLFFARVLWSVWSEVRSPVSVGTAPRAVAGMFGGRRRVGRSGAMTLVFVEPRSRRGSAITLSDVLAIGRDTENDICVADDTFMSGHHARLEVRPEGTWLVDLGSTNGTFVNGQRVDADRSVRRGDRIQVGSTVLEVRS